LALFLLWFFGKDISNLLDNLRTPNQLLTELRLENEGLRLEIAELKNKLSIQSPPYLTAQIYSRYPFNDNQILIVDAGSQNGVREGWPVLAAENHLLGKIIKVKASASEVRTIFSSDWRSAVKIGPQGIEALLKGGRQPKLELIPAGAQINLDDEVFSASPDLPMNLFIGKVGEINSQPTASLQEVKLKTDYDPSQIRKVFIVTDYEGFN